MDAAILAARRQKASSFPIFATSCVNAFPIGAAPSIRWTSFAPSPSRSLPTGSEWTGNLPAGRPDLSLYTSTLRNSSRQCSSQQRSWPASLPVPCGQSPGIPSRHHPAGSGVQQRRQSLPHLRWPPYEPEPAHHKFRMETLQGEGRQLFDCSQYSGTAGIASPYHYIEMAKTATSFPYFEWEGVLYCFVVLPFWFASAPWLFTAVLGHGALFFRWTGVDLIC